jgi:hypothetical protein
VRNFNRARLCDGSALSRGRSAEPEEPDGGRVLDSNIKRVAEPEREEPDDDGRYYAPHEFDGRPDVYATGGRSVVASAEARAPGA